MSWDFLQPSNLKEATEMLNCGEDLRILAGGTDLIVQLRERKISCRYVMDIKKIPELNVFGKSGKSLEIGGAINLNMIQESDLCGSSYSVLKDGAYSHANYLLRNRATLIWNICNASPGGDMIPASLVLDGTLEAVSTNGSRLIPLRDFFTGAGKHVLQKNELITKIIFPEKEGQGVYFKKKRTKGHDLAQMGVAGFWASDGKLSFGMAVLAPTPLLISGLGPFDKNSLVKARPDIEAEVLGRISPRDSRRSTKEYRIAMVKHFIGEIISRFTEGSL